MELGNFLLLILAMGILSLALAIALIAAIVTWVGWLVRLLVRLTQRNGRDLSGRGSGHAQWLSPLPQEARG
jgi:hypothetical protein